MTVPAPNDWQRAVEMIVRQQDLIDHLKKRVHTLENCLLRPLSYLSGSIGASVTPTGFGVHVNSFRIAVTVSDVDKMLKLLDVEACRQFIEACGVTHAIAEHFMSELHRARKEPAP